MIHPVVSIIVPCYKQAHFLEQSLHSVLAQTLEYWECIIVNDGSTDATEYIAKQWVEKDDRFKYIYKENGGLSSARNKGIAISNGTYILPLDADDVLHRDYLKKLLPVIENNSRVAIVSCHTKFFSKEISNSIGGLTPVSGTVHNILHVNQIIATSLYRKSSWEQAGGYDESMKNGFEDWEFWIRILKNEFSYEVFPESLFYYRKAKKSMLVNTIKNHSIEVKKYIVHKHRDLYIADFDNYVTVSSHDLQAATTKLRNIENSIEYKLAKLCGKPIRLVKTWLGIK